MSRSRAQKPGGSSQTILPSRKDRRADRRSGVSKPRGRRPEARARRRFLPKQKAARIVIYLGVAIGYGALMWFVVFPWVDKTFVNRPAL